MNVFTFLVSRVHATPYVTMSVGWSVSVGRSVCLKSLRFLSLFPYSFNCLLLLLLLVHIFYPTSFPWLNILTLMFKISANKIFMKHQERKSLLKRDILSLGLSVTSKSWVVDIWYKVHIRKKVHSINRIQVKQGQIHGWTVACYGVISQKL